MFPCKSFNTKSLKNLLFNWDKRAQVTLKVKMVRIQQSGAELRQAQNATIWDTKKVIRICGANSKYLHLLLWVRVRLCDKKARPEICCWATNGEEVPA